MQLISKVKDKGALDKLVYYQFLSSFNSKKIGLKVKRFPIQRYLKMETSSILACNHGKKIQILLKNM